jgi:trans-aconitate 2-methyltransferase
MSTHWDADAYHRISDVQQAWAEQVLDRLPLRGDETVLDAGCGSGAVTARLLERLPRGHVVAVDASQEMVDHARAALGDRATVLRADLAAIELDEPVDAVFSNAVFHWVRDHDALFAHLHGVLRPGGRLVAQCGGAGNLDRFWATAHEVAGEPPFAEHVGGLTSPTYFAGVPETQARLRACGFAEHEVWLEPAPVTPGDPAAFIRVVNLRCFVDRLPEALVDRFVDTVLERAGEPLVLDYVRLNIDATA